MTRSSRKVIILMIMFILVALYFVSGTYARYTSSITANAKVSTANWAVAFKKGSDAITKDTVLTFEVQKNANVVNGKIAPGTTATATINLDLTGTEVAVDYTASINAEALEETLGENVKVTVNNSDSATGTVNINNDGTALDKNSVEILISITWVDNNTAEANESDISAAGQTDLVLPVTLKVEQHI